MIEQQLERIAVALETLIKQLGTGSILAPATVNTATRYEAPAPVAPAAPVAAPLPFMGIPAAPAPVAAAPQVPFTDTKGMIDYVMGVYKAVGPDKGAQIQSILVGLGVKNINEVPVGKFPQLFAQVEALKG